MWQADRQKKEAGCFFCFFLLPNAAVQCEHPNKLDACGKTDTGDDKKQ